MTRKAMMKLLSKCQWKDQPVLILNDSDYWGSIKLQLNETRIETLIRRNMSISGADHRLALQWLKYNKWLNQWYIQNSPGNHLSQENEYRTQLRAAGYTEPHVERCVENYCVMRKRREVKKTCGGK